MTQKKVKEYYVPIMRDPLKSREYAMVKVEGTPVKFKGLEEFRFFAYDCKQIKSLGFRVDEDTTGSLIAENDSNRLTAIQDAKRKLTKISKDSIRTAIQITMKRIKDIPKEE